MARQDDLANENAPLLANNQIVPDSENSPNARDDELVELLPSKRVQWHVSATATFMVTAIQFGQTLVVPAMQQITEDNICYARYPDHKLRHFKPADPRCKGSDVQGELAILTSWIAVLDLILPALVQIPFGVMSDRYSRKYVLFAAQFGAWANIIATVIILAYPDRFSVWNLLIASATYLIGGGGMVATGLSYTIISDVVSASNRANIFYIMNAAMRAALIIASPLAAKMLDINPWTTMLTGVGIMTAAPIAVLALPETLGLRKVKMAGSASTDSNNAESSTAEQPLIGSSGKRDNFAAALRQTLSNDFLHVWEFLRSSKSFAIVLAAAAFANPMKLAFIAQLLQYMTNRFHWTWSQAAYAVSVENTAIVFYLMIILPAVSSLLTRFGWSVLGRDLFLLRSSIGFMALSGVLLSVASAPWMCIAALLVFSLSSGYAALLRAVLTLLVSDHSVGTLNTVIALVESVVSALFAPLMGVLLKRGLELGGAWSGLSFIFAGSCATVAFILVMVYRLPKQHF